MKESSIALFLVLGLSAAASAAGPRSSSVAPATPASAELVAFREAQQRFSSRARELEADTRTFLDEVQSAERLKLSAGYDSSIQQLTASEGVQRDLTVERFEDFLLRYPGSPYASHVRFRLADLKWEEAKEQYLAAAQAYEARAAQLETDNRLDELEPEPKLDLSRVLELYQAIVADNEKLAEKQQYEFLDGAFYSLGFLHTEERADAYDPIRARDAFQKLVTLRPNSPLADEAHLRLGNFLFEEGRFRESIPEFWTIYSKGPKAELYGTAMYQLAWAYYKLDIYDKPAAGDPPDASAMALFVKLLDFSEEQFQQRGVRSDFAPDAIKFMAFSLADIAERQQGDPVDVAKSYFASLDATKVDGQKSALPRKYERDVYVALGEALVKYGRFDQAINVYRALQRDAWLYEPENPEYQMMVVKLLATGASRDLAASAAARIELTEKYNDRSDWWRENRTDPEALAIARKYIEESLADVAIEFRKNADQDQSPDSYKLAAEKFREYLDRFPISDDFFQMQWYLADTLYRARDFVASAKEFENLVRSSRHHAYGEGALYQLMLSRMQGTIAAHGPLKQLPSDATVGSTETSSAGTTVQVYALSREHVAFVDAVDVVLDYGFSPTQGDSTQPVWKDEVEKNRVALAFTAAEIIFLHQRFEDARERFFAIIGRYPLKDEASYAAGLVIDSFTAEGDLASVRKYSGIYAKMQLGSSPTVLSRGATFANIEEEAAFNEASSFIEKGERGKAADAFVKFIADFQKSKHAQAALYNAANNYDIVGKVELSNQLFEKYVQKYPTDDKSARLYLRIAGNYESVFELDKAIDYYEKLLRNFPNNEFSSDAQYNASFLRIGIGDHAGAAKGFEDYAKKFPTREDLEAVVFKAGEQWEQVSPQKAITFYESYLQRFGLEQPEHALLADHRLAGLYQKAGNAKKAQFYMDRLVSDFDAAVAAGKDEKILRSRNYAAASAFRPVQAAYEVLIKDHLTGKDEADAALIQSKEKAILDFRSQTLGAATRFGDFEYTTAILFLRAKSILYYAELGFELRPPSGLTEEEEAAFLETLENEVYPQFYSYQDSAKAELQQLLQLAKERKYYSSWVGMAAEELYKLDPFSFPAEKQEIRGKALANDLPVVLPVTMDSAANGNRTPTEPSP